MTNRINPGTPPNERPDRGSPRSQDSSTFDQVAKVSIPFQEMLSQQDRNGPDKDSGAFYDLSAIHAAAKRDPHLAGRGTMTPKVFTVDYDHTITALDDSDPGRVLADREAAFSYTQVVDPRVQIAVGKVLMSRNKAAVEGDPIQAGVDSCEGGPFGLMFVAMRAIQATGQTPEDYFAAVMERARKQAAGLDPIAAESLVESVRSSIAGCPDLRKVVAEGFDPETD